MMTITYPDDMNPEDALGMASMLLGHLPAGRMAPGGTYTTIDRTGPRAVQAVCANTPDGLSFTIHYLVR